MPIMFSHTVYSTVVVWQHGSKRAYRKRQTIDALTRAGGVDGSKE